jgi:hypothetical protein
VIAIRTGKRTARSASLAIRSLLLVYKRTRPSEAPAAISPFERTETHQTIDAAQKLATLFMSRSRCYPASPGLLTRNGRDGDGLLAFSICSAPDSNRAIFSARDETASERVGDGRERVDERVVPGQRVHAFSGQERPEADGAEAEQISSYLTRRHRLGDVTAYASQQE